MSEPKMHPASTYESAEWMLVYSQEDETTTPQESHPTDWVGAQLSGLIIESPLSKPPAVYAATAEQIK
jgi:hypothetical protein